LCGGFCVMKKKREWKKWLNRTKWKKLRTRAGDLSVVSRGEPREVVG